MRNQLSSNQWNWGAFLLCPFWCVRYQVWLGMISILPTILISLMSLISLGSFSLLLLVLKIKLHSLLSGVVSAILLCLIYVSGGVFLLAGKNMTMIILTFSYFITSVSMGLKGDKLAMKKMNREQDIQRFKLEKRIWMSLGLLFFIPVDIMIFYLTEKSVSISIDLVQLPGI